MAGYDNDDEVRPCRIYFGDSVLQMIVTSGLNRILPALVLDAVQFRHWFLLFDFGDRAIVCEDVIEKGSKNTGSCAEWDPSRECKLSYLKTIFISPASVHCLSYNNPFNGISYSVKDRSCHDWIFSMCTSICVRNELNLAIFRRMRDNWTVNVLLAFLKNSLGNLKDTMHYIT